MKILIIFCCVSCAPVTGQKINHVKADGIVIKSFNHVKADSIVTKHNKEAKFTRGCIVALALTAAFVATVAK
jgi:hypothetical protein